MSSLSYIYLYTINRPTPQSLQTVYLGMMQKRHYQNILNTQPVIKSECYITVSLVYETVEVPQTHESISSIVDQIEEA